MKNLNLTDIEERVEGSSFENLARIDMLYVGSKLENKEQIEFLKKLGVKVAIDMKEAGETPFADAAELEKEGIKYIHFPVSDLSKISFEDLIKLTDLLKADSEKKFLYCMSGNRVAAMLALQQCLVCGHPKKRIIELAKRIGLNKEGLEQKLKEKLNI